MIRAIDHINIASADLKATRDFFVDILGFEDGPRPSVGVPGHWLYIGGRAIVHVQQAKGPVAPSRESALNHVAFEVDDLTPIAAKLDHAGVAYRMRALPEAGVRQIFIEDLTGVFLELSQRD